MPSYAPRTSTRAVVSPAAFALAGLAVVLVTAATLVAPPIAAQEGATAIDPAQPPRELFLAYKCNLCHAIAGEDIARKSENEKTRGPDLGGVGERHSAEWIQGFLLRQETLEGEKHKKNFTGAPETARKLADWLVTLPSTTD